jgi:hypothetical protein
MGDAGAQGAAVHELCLRCAHVGKVTPHPLLDRLADAMRSAQRCSGPMLRTAPPPYDAPPCSGRRSFTSACRIGWRAPNVTASLPSGRHIDACCARARTAGGARPPRQSRPTRPTRSLCGPRGPAMPRSRRSLPPRPRWAHARCERSRTLTYTRRRTVRPGRAGPLRKWPPGWSSAPPPCARGAKTPRPRSASRRSWCRGAPSPPLPALRALNGCRQRGELDALAGSDSPTVAVALAGEHARGAHLHRARARAAGRPKCWRRRRARPQYALRRLLPRRGAAHDRGGAPRRRPLRSAVHPRTAAPPRRETWPRRARS